MIKTKISMFFLYNYQMFLLRKFFFCGFGEWAQKKEWHHIVWCHSKLFVLFREWITQQLLLLELPLLQEPLQLLELELLLERRLLG